MHCESAEEAFPVPILRDADALLVLPDAFALTSLALSMAPRRFALKAAIGVAAAPNL